MWMKVYIKEPGKALELKEIDNTLEELQRIVGGYIETVTVASDCIIICNEEGRINDMPYNCTLFGMQFFGTLIFAGADGEELCDLPDAGRELLMNATKKYTEIFKLKEMLEKENIPFVFTDDSHIFEFIGEKKYQIEYPCTYKSSKRICSVVQGYGTYGAEQNLLEIMGLLTPEEAEQDSVCGWLTADNVFERIKKHWEGVRSNG